MINFKEILTFEFFLSTINPLFDDICNRAVLVDFDDFQPKQVINTKRR